MKFLQLTNALRSGTSTRALLIALGAPMALASVAQAGSLPAHGHFVSGQGSINKANQSLTVKQSSTTGIVNWNSFSVGKKSGVTFDNGNGATLNRVTGGNLSTIAGSLRATGSLYLMNTQGVIVSGSGRVVTGGSFVATSAASPDDDRFKNVNAKVVNHGTIISRGSATLAGSHVTDTGTIRASKVDLDAGRRLVIDGAIVARHAHGSGGTIIATGRHIDVKDHADISADGTTGGVVLIGGDVDGGAVKDADFVQQAVRAARTTHIAKGATISADASRKAGGDIIIWSNGHTTFGGSISAKGVTNGGFSEVSSHDLLGFTGTVDLTTHHGATGTLLLDPENVTITNAATTNGSLTSSAFTPSGDNSILNAGTLEAALQTASVKITTGATGAQTGDITVLAPLVWSSSHTLTLDAFHSVFVGANVSIQGSGGLTIDTNDGGSGGTYGLVNGASIDYGPVDNGGKLKINGTSYKLLYTMAALQDINSNLTADYALATSLDGSSTSGWVPLGTNSSMVLNSNHGFTGIFEGLGNTVSGLKISRTENYVGLFGFAGGMIRDIGLIGGSAKGDDETGALVGDLEGTLLNAFATGTVSGGTYVGGLVGFADSSSKITQAFSTGAVTGSSAYTGGLIGDNHGTVSASYATGTVTGTGTIGGFVGYNTGSISGSYATGDVHDSGTVSGGFVGENASGGAIDGAYESGTATGSTDVGGFLGEGDSGSSMGATTRIIWNSSNNAVPYGINSGGFNIVALTTAQMLKASNFSGWTFGTTPGATGWVIVDANGSLNNAGTVTGGTTPMLLSEYSVNIAAPHQLQLMELGLAAGYTLANNINMSGTAGGDVWSTGGFIAVGGNNSSANFTGTFAGGGNTISHLTIADATNMQVGLFGTFNGAVDDLKLTSVSISSTTNSVDLGALAGANVGTVTGVSVSGAVTTHAGASIGGLVGANSGKIASATSSATVLDTAGGSNMGGLAGDSSGTIIGSSASGQVTGIGDDNVGGLVADNGGNIIGSHATGDVTVTSSNDAWIGGLVGLEESTGRIASSYATGNVTGSKSIIGGLVGNAASDIIVNSYATGDVSGVDDEAGGLVGVDNAGSISGSYATGKVTVTYGTGNANYAGGLVGNYTGMSTSEISNSYATGAVSTVGPHAAAGGLVGYATKVQIASSYATGNVEASDTTNTLDYAGGLVGEANTDVTISASHATGNVTGDDVSYAGGLIGYNFTTNTVDNTYATGDVAGLSAGGLIGLSAMGNIITNSHASGDVTGVPGNNQVYVGGLIGYSSNDTTIASDYATGDADGKITSVVVSTYAGGLIGILLGTETLVSSYATGDVTEAYQSGGLVGYSSAAIFGSHATGNASASSGGNAGGLVGQSLAAISYSYATGNTIGLLGTDSFAGGLVAYNQGSIDHSFATGNETVAGTGADAGGLAGYNSAAVSYSYATGSVTGDGSGMPGSNFGGLIGSNAGTVNQAYALGDISNTGTGSNGGAVGNNTGTVTATYWDTQTSGRSTSAGGVGLTTAQLQSGLPKGFSNSEWAVIAGTSFPYLKWQFASGTPQVISGTVSGSGNAGTPVDVRVNGTLLTPVIAMSSGANGYYYELLAPGTISSSGSDVLVFEDGSTHANTVIESAKGSLANIDLMPNTLIVDGTASSETSLLSAMEKALGSASSSHYLYTSSGNFTSGIDLDMNLSASSFSLNHSIDIGSGDLTFDAAGSITESSSDAIDALSLTGTSGGNAEFNSATNVITDLGKFSTAGHTFELENNHDITTTGTVNAGSKTIKLVTTGSGHDIKVESKLEGDTVDLASSATITENSSGDIDATTFTGSSAGATTLTAGTNTFTDLGAFTSGGALALSDDHALTVDGTVNAGSNTVSLTTTGSNHDLAIDAKLTGGTVNFVTTGEATESSSAAIIAHKLNVTAKTGIDLTSTHNNITTLGTHTTNSGPNKITL